MRHLLVSFLVFLGFAFTSCVGTKPDSELKVETWHSPQGTVQLDYLLGHDAGCKAVTAWLDSIKTSYKEEDLQVKCNVFLIYQDAEYLTYYYNVQTLASEYYEGDESSQLYTFGRQDGHVIKSGDLVEDLDGLSKQVLAHAKLENAWAVEVLGGEVEFLDFVKYFTVGVTTRGLTFCYPIMEGTWQPICTIPSSELKLKAK